MENETCNSTKPAISGEPLLAPVIVKPIHAKPSLITAISEKLERDFKIKENCPF